MRYGQNCLSQAANLFKRRVLGAKLNQVRAPIAKLLCHGFRRAPAQASRIDKGVKLAFP
jgi:hypothetical protein